MAILQGKSPESLLPPPPPKKENDSEQPAYDQFLAAQGLKARDLEQREMTVRTNIQQFQEELNKIVEEKKRVQSVRDDLQAKLDEMNASAAAAGIGKRLADLADAQAQAGQGTARAETGKRRHRRRRQAPDRACRTASGPRSSPSSRPPTEMEQIGEVLNRIRQGQPAKGMIDETGKKLQPPKGPGP